MAKPEPKSETDPQELAALLEIYRQVISLETQPLLELILEQLKVVVDYTGATIVALEGDQVTVFAYRGPIPQEKIIGWDLPLQETRVSRELISRQEPLIISDIRGDTPRARAFRETAGERLETAFGYAHAWMGLPLMAREQVIGILSLLHRQPSYYTPDHANRALVFARHCARALEKDRLYRQAHQLATLEERDRLARELHDTVAQALGYLNLTLSSLGGLLSKGQLAEAQTSLDRLKQIVGELYTEVREEIFNLRLTTAAELGFLEMLCDYSAKYKEYYHFNLDLAIEIDETLLVFPENVRTQLIRIIEEALMNVRKYAGVDRAVIQISSEADQIQISVEDRGRGFDLAQIARTGESGFGLEVMGERAESIGARLDIKAAPGEGVKVTIWLPHPSGKEE